MKDIIIFKDNFVNVNDNSVIVNMSLAIKEFSNVYFQKDTDLGLKELSYVALVSSYNSPLIIRGLTDNELHQEACKKVGLPIEYIPSKNVKVAIKKFKSVYNNGVFGIIKELYVGYELTRKSISVINKMLSIYQNKLIDGDIDNLTDEEINKLNSNITTILTNVSKIRDISSNLEDDINNLKKVEAKVVAIENKEAMPLGGGTIPKSARRLM